MKFNWVSRNWFHLSSRPGKIFWKEAALRMVADVFSVNASRILAILVYFFLRTAIWKGSNPEDLFEQLRTYVLDYSLFWSLLALSIFHLNGFYSWTRGYRGRYKARVVIRAATMVVGLSLFVDYFLFRGIDTPRSVAVLTWFFLLATVGGSRLGMHLFTQIYHLEPKHPVKRPEHVLVVGGAGYLGSVLVRILVSRGYRVRILDSLLFGKSSLSALADEPDCELIAGDVRDIETVVQSMKGCHAVIDLAAIVGDPACDEHQVLAKEVNRAATRMLIDVCRGQGIRRFLFASTCSVYGASDVLMDERSAVVPISLYGHTKVDSENLLLGATSTDFQPTILRLATLFGMSPRPRFDLVVNLLTARAIRVGKITVFNGEQWRPFMHVHDAARAFLTCLEADLEVVSGEVFNAGSNSLNHRLSEIASEISQIVPNVEIDCVENQDRRNYQVSFDKIHRRLGFTCKQTLKGGICELADVLRTAAIDDFSTGIYNNRATVHAYAGSADADRSSIRVLNALAHGE
jgi:nucleoside-diphosphate-sugar epimerase